jgi:uncharacterized protein YjiS (DUF1127 family)
VARSWLSITQIDRRDEIYLLDEWKSSTLIHHYRCSPAPDLADLPPAEPFLENRNGSLAAWRAVSCGWLACSPIRGFFAWIAQVKANRSRRIALRGLLDLDTARLKDLGIERADIAEAMTARNGRTPGMVLNAARARSARA